MDGKLSENRRKLFSDDNNAGGEKEKERKSRRKQDEEKRDATELKRSGNESHLSRKTLKASDNE